MDECTFAWRISGYTTAMSEKLGFENSLLTFDAFLAHKANEIQGKLIEKKDIFCCYCLVALQNASRWMSVLTSLLRLSYENVG